VVEEIKTLMSESSETVVGGRRVSVSGKELVLARRR
jgi:hypothetical protein